MNGRSFVLDSRMNCTHSCPQRKKPDLSEDRRDTGIQRRPGQEVKDLHKETREMKAAEGTTEGPGPGAHGGRRKSGKAPGKEPERVRVAEKRHARRRHKGNAR